MGLFRRGIWSSINCAPCYWSPPSPPNKYGVKEADEDKEYLLKNTDYNEKELEELFTLYFDLCWSLYYQKCCRCCCCPAEDLDIRFQNFISKQLKKLPNGFLRQKCTYLAGRSFTEMDKNGDGKVVFREFVIALARTSN